MPDTIETGPSDSAPADDGGEAMHVHKPKVLHGLREFMGEISVIVVGVIIALAAEQAVEAWHWAEQTRETETALRAEIQSSVDNVAERFAINNCLERQLAALQTAALTRKPIAQPFAKPPSRVIPDVYFSPWGEWTWGSWQAASASGALSRMNPARVNTYADIYKSIQDIDDTIRRERETEGSLAPLTGSSIDQAEANQIMVALTNLDRDRSDILIAGRDLLNDARSIGLKPGPRPLSYTDRIRKRINVCR